MTRLNHQATEYRPRRAIVDSTQATHQEHIPKHASHRKLNIGELWRNRGFRRAVGTIAGVALAAGVGSYGITRTGNPESHRPPENPVAAAPLQPDATPNTVGVSLNKSGKKFTDTTPSNESIRNAIDYCPVVEVSLPAEYDYDEVMIGAQTEFALSTEDYEKALKKLEQADDRKQMNAIVSDVLGELGIETVFDETMPDDMVPAENDLTRDQWEANYRIGMQTHMRGMTYMPMSMAKRFEKVNFINAHAFSQPGDDRPSYAYYDDENREAGFAVLAAHVDAFIHEGAHAIHEKVCDDYDDAELKEAYDKAIKLLNSNPHRADLENKFREKYDEDDAKSEEGKEYIKQGKKFGFPSDYSRESYSEMFAELTEDIVFQRGFLDNLDTESARELEAHVIARLQMGLKEDAKSWLQFMALYNRTLPQYSISPKEIMDKKVAPYDFTYQEFKDLPGVDLREAVRLEMENGYEMYLYAAQPARTKDLTMSFVTNSSLTNETEQKIKDAALEYMQRFAEAYDRKVHIDQGPGLIKGTYQVTLTFEPPVMAASDEVPSAEDYSIHGR